MVYERALSKCMSICSTSEKCINDMELKMQKWEVSFADQQKVVEYLIAEKYIDHSRFVRAFVNDKIKYNHWGKVKVRFHLKQKRIESKSIGTGLMEFPDDTYQEILKEEVIKKLKTTKASSDYERNNKVAKSLMGKGFEPGLVFSILKHDVSE